MQNGLKIGQGNYGCVYRMVLKNEPRAVKAIPFFYNEDRDDFRNELHLLRQLSGNPYVCAIQGQVEEAFQGFIIMPYYNRELYKHIRFQYNDAVERQKYMLQIALGLQHLKRNNVLHRDLSSRNIMIDAQDTIKICDFGMAVQFKPKTPRSIYVCTLPYRAIELLLGELEYDFAIDVWSFGCLYLEFIYEDFYINEKDETDQLRQIGTLIGMPPAPGKPSVSLLQPIENIDALEMHLLQRTLDTCAKTRITIEKVVDALVRMQLCQNHPSQLFSILMDDPVFHRLLCRYYVYTMAQTTSYSLVSCKGSKFLVVFKNGRIFNVSEHESDLDAVELEDFNLNTTALTESNFKKLAEAINVNEARSFFEEENNILLMKNLDGALKWFYLRFNLIQDGRVILCLRNEKQSFKLKMNPSCRCLETSWFYVLTEEKFKQTFLEQKDVMLTFSFRESDDLDGLVKTLLRGEVTSMQRKKERALRHARKHLALLKKIEEKRALKRLQKKTTEKPTTQEKDSDEESESDDTVTEEDESEQEEEESSDEDEVDGRKLDALCKIAEKVDIDAARNLFEIAAKSYRID